MIFFKKENGLVKKIHATLQDFNRKGKVGKAAKDKRVGKGDYIGVVYDKKGKKGYV
jgi:hypothetical protein